jgi:predicted RNA-binding protein YlxR (DUF448 family)
MTNDEGDTTPDAEFGEDDPDTPEETGPLRRCVITRERLPKAKMIRFVIGPDRLVAPDLLETLPGRGIWLSAVGDVLEASLANGKLAGQFARAARGPVTLPVNLAAMLETGLRHRIGELIGLARRAGQTIAGFEKAGEWLLAGRAGLIIQAADGSAEERARFLGQGLGKAAAGKAGGRRAEVPVIAPLTAARLGAIFGRERAVHVAVAHGKLAVLLAKENDRLALLANRQHGAGGISKV